MGVFSRDESVRGLYCFACVMMCSGDDVSLAVDLHQANSLPVDLTGKLLHSSVESRFTAAVLNVKSRNSGHSLAALNMSRSIR